MTSLTFKKLFFIITFCFLSNLIHAQAQNSDNIILPDIDFSIVDNSSINTVNTEDALLNDRNPEFQKVYWEELTANSLTNGLSGSTYYTQKQNFSTMEFLYGSFNTIKFHALSQRLINNFFYKMSYDSLVRQNLSINNVPYLHSARYQNNFFSEFSYNLPYTFFTGSVSYQQKKISFFGSDKNQFSYFLPISFETKHWINSKSFIDMGIKSRLYLQNFQTDQGTVLQTQLLSDLIFHSTYQASFIDWNIFKADIVYEFNYIDQTTHQDIGYITLLTEFNLTKDLILKLGGTLVPSNVHQFFGWPEASLSYHYSEIFHITAGISGQYSPLSAQLLSSEIQLYSYNKTPETKWIYQISTTINASSFFEINGYFKSDCYFTKRIYSYNPTENLYFFSESGKINILGSGISAKARYPDIFDLSFAYSWENFPKTWLLYSQHIFDLILGVGYKPIGFWFETSFKILSPRFLDKDFSNNVLLLNFKLSQKIKKIATLTLELENALNQPIFYRVGAPAGGIQATGGFQLNF